MENRRRMSHLGVGPLYVAVITAVTGGAVYFLQEGYLSPGRISFMERPLFFAGIFLIVSGAVLWLGGALFARINRNIAANRLVTTGAYGWVRNPIYSAFGIVYTGILCLQNNLFLLVLPFFYWIFLTIIVKNEEKVLEEVFGDEYLEYKKKVNRCIPWFPE